MPSAIKITGLLLFLWAFSPLNCLSQQDTLHLIHGRHYLLHLDNGESVSGFVVEQSLGFVTLEKRPQLVRSEIRKSTIVSARTIGIRAQLEDVLGNNPHTGQYLLSVPALPFEPGIIHSTAHWFLFDNLQYAFSENVAIHASSLAFYPCGLGLRWSVKLDGMNHIGGNLSGLLQFGDDHGSDLLGHVALAKFTHGDGNRNFTFGAGYLGVNPELFNGYPGNRLLVHTPLVSAAFCNRFASKWSAVLDGFYLPDEGVLLAGAGMKFLRDDRMCWSFGFYSFVNNLSNPNLQGLRSLSFPIPYFSYSLKIGSQSGL